MRDYLDIMTVLSYSGANFGEHDPDVKRRSPRPRAQANQPSCPRCGGLMSAERFSDFRDQTGQFHFSGWRCLACGEVLDPVILANRRLPSRLATADKK